MINPEIPRPSDGGEEADQVPGAQVGRYETWDPEERTRAIREAREDNEASAAPWRQPLPPEKNIFPASERYYKFHYLSRSSREGLTRWVKATLPQNNSELSDRERWADMQRRAEEGFIALLKTYGLDADDGKIMLLETSRREREDIDVAIEV